MDLRSANSKNYYELLGITHEASTQEIRANYHELARVYHPDSNFYADITTEKVSADQIELFKIITSAYQTLIDPKKRQEYDAMLSPLLSNKISQWDESNDTFWDKQISHGTTASIKRARAPTFGQTGSRPFKATLREEMLRASQAEASVKAAIQQKSKQRTRTILFASLGLILGLASVCFILIKVKSDSGNQSQITGTDNQSNKTQPSKSWRTSLDG